MTITRQRLMAIVDQAIARGRPELQREFRNCPVSLEQFIIDSLRDAMRRCSGVDFCTYRCGEDGYGCPVTQANLRGSHQMWFTKYFDTLMCAELEPPPSLEQGWSALVTD